MPWDGEVLATGHQEVPEYKFLHEWTCWVILLIMFNIVHIHIDKWPVTP